MESDSPAHAENCPEAVEEFAGAAEEVGSRAPFSGHSITYPFSNASRALLFSGHPVRHVITAKSLCDREATPPGACEKTGPPEHS